MAWLAALGWLIWNGRHPVVWKSWQEGANVAAYLLLALVIPSLGLLQALELRNYLAWKSKRLGSSLVLRFLVIIDCWLVALVSGSIALLLAINLAEHWMKGRGFSNGFDGLVIVGAELTHRCFCIWINKLRKFARGCRSLLLGLKRKFRLSSIAV